MMRDVFHLEVTEGTDFTQSFLYADPCTQVPSDLTGFTADMKIKDNGNGTYDGYANPNVVLELSTANGGIVLGGTNGIVTIVLTNMQLTDTTWNRGVYNIVLTDMSGKKIPFLHGFITIISDTTAT
jgi:hypothetical protein